MCNASLSGKRFHVLCIQSSNIFLPMILSDHSRLYFFVFVFCLFSFTKSYSLLFISTLHVVADAVLSLDFAHSKQIRFGVGVSSICFSPFDMFFVVVISPSTFYHPSTLALHTQMARTTSDHISPGTIQQSNS